MKNIGSHTRLPISSVEIYLSPRSPEKRFYCAGAVDKHLHINGVKHVMFILMRRLDSVANPYSWQICKPFANFLIFCWREKLMVPDNDGNL